MQRKHHSADFKVKVVLEAIKGLKTVNEIASELGTTRLRGDHHCSELKSTTDLSCSDFLHLVGSLIFF